jgi:peptidoglycan/LPS O-acetylase OafA/YrhL
MTGPDSPSRLLFLDGLRFAAAAAVAFYHFTATPTAGSYWHADPPVEFAAINPVTRYGWLAVELFFVISGFVILMSARGRTAAQFVGSRVGRLFPAYWAAVGATALLQVLWSGGRHPSARDTLLNLTMAPDLFGAQPVQVVFWTLLVELKFYVLVGAIVALGGVTPRRALALALGWPIAGRLAELLGWSTAADVLVAHYAPYFGVGIVLYLLRSDGVTAVRLVALAATLGMGVQQVASSAEHASRLQGVPVHTGVAVAVVVAAAAAVWFGSGPHARVRSGPLATALAGAGALTYPLYLVHSQFGYAVIATLAPRAPEWLALVTALAASGGLAYLIHRAVERTTHLPLRVAVERALTPAAA